MTTNNSTLSLPPVTFAEVTEDNFDTVIALKVREDQNGMVRTNVQTLAEAYVDRTMRPLAVMAEDSTMVGFLCWAHEDESPIYWICRLMVDGRYQGRGYGASALRKALEVLSAHPDCTSIRLFYHPENQRARQLYASFGFVETGVIEDSQAEASLTT
jgi:diamine N-acetyltransferase